MLLVSIPLCSCENALSKVEIVEKPKTAEELKAELKELEMSNPLNYLDVFNVKMIPQQK